MLLRVYRQCDRGMAGLVYPDGRSLLDQPLLLLDAFNAISVGMDAIRKKPDADGAN